MELDEAQTNLAANIAAAWQRIGLGELADAAGVGENTIRNMAARRMPHATTLVRVAHAADTTVGALLGEPSPGVDRVLPGWSDMTDTEQATVRRTVEVMAAKHRQGAASETLEIPDPDDYETLDEFLAALPEVTRRSVTAALDIQNRSSRLRSAPQADQPPGGGVDKEAPQGGDREGPRGSAG